MDKSKIKPGQALMEALNFDETDLAANREGRFSQDQYEDLSRRWRMMHIGFVLLAISAFLMFILAAFSFNNKNSSTFLFAAFMSAAGAYLLISRYKRIDADIKDGKVLLAEGRIILNVEGSKSEIFSLQVENHKFRVNKEIFLAFKNGDPYAIYFASNARTLLSAEWLRN